MCVVVGTYPGVAMEAEAEHDATWARIVASPLAGAYITEVHSLATDISERAERVLSEAPKPPKDQSYIKVDHRMMADLVALVNQAARLKALITDRAWHKNQESKAQAEIRHRRAAWLRGDLLRGLKIETVLEADVRHSIEHFDEYLDDTALAAVDGRLSMPALIPLDMAVGRRRTLSQPPDGGTKPHVRFLRVYIASEAVFVNAGREVSIRNLRTECRRIAKRLAPHVPKDDDGERGSSMYVLASESFNRG